MAALARAAAAAFAAASEPRAGARGGRASCSAAAAPCGGRAAPRPCLHSCRAEAGPAGAALARGAAAAAACRRPCRASAAAAAPAAGSGRQVVVIDNYDSFTYNICQYLGDLGCDYVVLTNDEKTVEQVRAMNPRGILISPGPGRPEDSGISLEAVKQLGPDFPLFGVCMGHQCIGQVFGGKVIRAPCGVMHGKTSPVTHSSVGVLAGMPSPFTAARYHSLVIDKASCPPELEMTAFSDDGMCMAVRHRTYPHIQGVQFHPESIITQDGKNILRNWVESLPQ